MLEQRPSTPGPYLRPAFISETQHLLNRNKIPGIHKRPAFNLDRLLEGLMTVTLVTIHVLLYASLLLYSTLQAAAVRQPHIAATVIANATRLWVASPCSHGLTNYLGRTDWISIRKTSIKRPRHLFKIAAFITDPTFKETRRGSSLEP